MKSKVGKIVAIVIAVAILIGILSTCFTVVEAGHTGVVLTFGAVSDSVLNEGIHFKIPFVQKVILVNNRTQKIETQGTASSKDLQIVSYEEAVPCVSIFCETQGTASSKDLQIVSYVVAVNFRVNNTASADLYKNVGADYSNVIVAPAIQESIKAVTAQFTAEQLITERQSVGDQIKTALSEKINKYGITVEIFNIVNFDFSDEFNAAVEAKQTAQQQALKAEQDLARIEVEAKQKVTQAQAEADSIRLIQEALSSAPDYVEYIKWNKWNGELPKVMSDSGVIVDVGDVVSAE